METRKDIKSRINSCKYNQLSLV